ncbi:MAG TPA: hypothetical protein VF104_02985 [Burkholderiales bacterium]
MVEPTVVPPVPTAALLISFLYGVGAALVALPGSLSWHRLRPRHHEAP